VGSVLRYPTICDVCFDFAWILVLIFLFDSPLKLLFLDGRTIIKVFGVSSFPVFVSLPFQRIRSALMWSLMEFSQGWQNEWRAGSSREGCGWTASTMRSLAHGLVSRLRIVVSFIVTPLMKIVEFILESIAFSDASASSPPPTQ